LPSAEGGSSFFHPSQLHLEPSELLERLGLAGLGVGRVALGAVGEGAFGPGDQRLLPGVDEGRVDAELPGQLVDGAVAADRGQSDLGLEGGRVVLARACQRFPFPGPPE